MKNNIFDNPEKYIDEIKKVIIPSEIMEEKKAEHSGKSMLCAWLTKLCPAKCAACFFKSNMYRDEYPSEKYELSNYGLNKLIEFINSSNNSYLMLSGGGEPMIKINEVNEIIKRTKTDRIVIVTSGIWANTYENTLRVIDELFESVQARNDHAVVVLRLSIDSFHFSSPSLGLANYRNIINIFKEKYKDEKKFILRIHTMQDDLTLEEVIDKVDDSAKIVYNKKNGVTDNNEIIKIVPKEAKIIFSNGYEIHVGLSKLFLSNLKIDLNFVGDDVRRALEVFEKDMKVSEYGNPSIVTNCNGLQGLDFWSDYNGNITAWGCQQPNDIHSFYTDDYQKIIEDIYNNINTYSFLDKGYYYRRNIVREINPIAVLRSEAMNLRDYAGAFLMEETKTQLYYSIRVIKDYLSEGVLSNNEISKLSEELLAFINLDVPIINNNYNESKHDILVQYILNEKKYSQKDWDDLFVLIKLGHYKIHDLTLLKAIEFYNIKYGETKRKVEDFNDSNDEAQLARLHNRISPMNEEAEKFCIDRGKSFVMHKNFQ